MTRLRKVKPASGTRRWWIVLLAALAIAAFLSPLASPAPDGLERVAEDHGLSARARAWLTPLFPHYTSLRVAHPVLTTSLAGVAGTLLTLGAGWGLTALLKRRKPGAPGPEIR
ncbi:MAG: PDGLE domain-containing protein [Betaproteobacteria bacterium]